MKFNEDDIREACSDIRRQINDKLSEDFSAYNIEYREEFNNTVESLEKIVNDNDDYYFDEICEIVLEGYDKDFAEYLETNHIADILSDEAQDQIEYLNEHCEFSDWDDDYIDEDNY